MPRLILQNNWCLPCLKDAKLKLYFFGNEVDRWRQGFWGNSELKKWRSKEITKFLTKIERKKLKNTQNILIDGCYLLLRSIGKQKAFVCVWKPCLENSKKKAKVLKKVQFVKNLEKFWINDKTVIESGFRIMWWRIVRISEFTTLRLLPTSADNIFFRSAFFSHSASLNSC